MMMVGFIKLVYRYLTPRLQLFVKISHYSVYAINR